MRLKIVLLVALGLVGLTGVAKAAGLFGDSVSTIVQREQALAGRVQQGGATISRSRRGPRGKRGPRGPQGPPGFSSVVMIESVPVSLAGNGGVDIAKASCPAGTIVIGGGFKGLGLVLVPASGPLKEGNGWGAVGANLGESPVLLYAYASCGG